MTVPSTPRRAGPFTGDDVNDTFPFNFKTTDTAEVRVVELDIATSVEVELTLDADYTVSLNVDQEDTPGGDVITTVPLPSTKKITLIGKTPYSQPVDLPDGGDYRAQQVEDALDRLASMAQQLKEEVDRCAKVSVSSTDADALNESINVLSANLVVLQTIVANISALVNLAAEVDDINTLAPIAASISTLAAIAANVTTVAGISGNVTTVAGISGNVTTVAGIAAAVSGVAAIAAAVSAVATIDDEIVALAAITAAINTVAGSIASVNTVAADIASVNTVAANIADVGVAADNIAAILAAPAAAVAADSSADAAAASAAEAAGYALGLQRVTTGGVTRANINGKVLVVTAGVTIPANEFQNGDVFGIENDSGAAVTITQGVGLTLYNSGTGTNGNLTLGARGFAAFRAKSGTVIYGSGPGAV